ncbi:MAG: CPBP family intramembrane metalloprotease [Lachnospiraceae bacterium]|nr:CPBP family intramembrane metalloprotease [Lachnospiraceae bacterium]
MSKDLFKRPQFVEDAAAAKKGMNWILEILVFIAVFFACNMFMGIIQTPATMIIAFSDADYMRAVQSGDIAAIMEASMTIATNNVMFLIMLFSEIMMIVVACLFCKLIQKRKMSTMGFVKKGMIKEYLIGAVVGFVIFSIAVLIGVVTGGLKIEGISPTFSLGLFILYLLGFMIQGMAEEVLCRGYFMVSYARRYPMYAAILANALVFAILHLGNSGITTLSFINLILFGIFASVYFIRRGSLWGIGALHSIWNFVQGNFYGILVSGNPVDGALLSTATVDGKELFSGGSFGLEGSLSVSIVLIAGTLILYFWKKKPMEAC